MQVPSKLSPTLIHFQVAVSSPVFWHCCSAVFIGLQRYAFGVHSRHSFAWHVAAPLHVTVRVAEPSSRHTDSCVGMPVTHCAAPGWQTRHFSFWQKPLGGGQVIDTVHVGGSA